MWDAAENGGKCKFTLAGHSDIIMCISFAPEKSMVASVSGDGTFRLWDLTARRCLHTVDWECGPVNLCTITKYGSDRQNALVTCHWDVHRESSRILVWDLEGNLGWANGHLVSHVMHFEGFAGKITCLDSTDNGDSVLLAAGCADGTVKVCDLTEMISLYDLTGQHTPTLGLSRSITALQFSPNGESLATAGLDGKVHVWETEEGAHRVTFFGHQGKVCCVDWKPCGSKLVSCGQDKTIKVWACKF